MRQQTTAIFYLYTSSSSSVKRSFKCVFNNWIWS